MERKTKKATVETAYGKKLDTPLTFDFNWTAYADGAELQQSGDMLSIDEQVKVRNTQRENKARQAAQTVAFEAAGIVKPTAENDEQVRLKEVFKNLMTAKVNGQPKYTVEQAREVAATVTGVEWEE